MNKNLWLTLAALAAAIAIVITIVMTLKNPSKPEPAFLEIMPTAFPVAKAEPTNSPAAVPTATPEPLPTEPPPAAAPAITEPEESAPAVRLSGPYRIEGSVISIARAPVDNATVEIRKFPPASGASFELNLQTNDAGLFSVGLSAPGRYVLTAFREGYTRSTATVEFWMKGVETAEIILRPGDAIYGQVFENLTGRVLPGVVVCAQARSRSYSRDEMRAHRWIETETDKEGRYRFDGLLSDISYRLWIADGEHEPLMRQDIKPGGPPVDFYLNPGLEVSGRVVWADDESPVQGARVGIGFGRRFGNLGRRFFQAQGWSSLTDLVSATSDADGYFTMRGLPKRRLPLSASYQEDENLIYYSNVFPINPEATDFDNTEEIVLRINREPPARVFGKVIDLDRRPVHNATVRIQSGMPGMGRMGRWVRDNFGDLFEDESGSVLTDNEGKYEIIVYQSGFYTIEAEKQNLVGTPEGRNRMMIRQGAGDHELNFTLIPGVHLSGRVVDASSGRPLPRVSLRLSEERDQEDRGRGGRRGWRNPGVLQETISTTGGLFDFGVVELGRYRLGVTEAPPDYRLPEEAISVVLTEPGKEEVEVKLSPGYSIAGVVYNLQGNPASGVWVQAHVLNSRIDLQDESDALGRFLLDGFPPREEIRILAYAPRGGEEQPAPTLTGPLVLSKSIDDYELRLKEGATLNVLVQNEESQPLAGQRVNLEFEPDLQADEWNFRPRSVFRRNNDTRNEGQTQFRNLTPGAWRATVQTVKEPVVSDTSLSEGQEAGMTLVIPNDSLVDNSGVLAGRVLFEDGAPAPNYRVVAVMQGDQDDEIMSGRHGSDRTDENGEFRIRELRQNAGFRLEVHRRPRIIQQETRTTNEDIVIRIPPESAVTVRVENTGGGPPAGNWSIRLIQMNGPRGNRPADRDADIDRASGYVTWDGLDEGAYRAIVTGDGFARTISEPIVLQSGMQQTDTVIRVLPSEAFAGQVMDEQSGKPVVAAEVAEYFAPGSLEHELRYYLSPRTTYTDATGDFLLEDLPSGPVHLRITHPAYEDGEYTEEFIPPGEVEIRLKKVEPEGQ